MAKTYQDIQNELGVNEGNSIVELIAKMNDYNVVSPSEITKIISVSVDRLENQVTGKAKEVKRRMYEPVTDDTKGIVSVLNKRIVLLDMIINKLKLEALDILNQHRTNYSNPHKVTKTQVGLNNVDNTSDLDKPISKATQTALNEISSDLDTHKNNTSNPHNVTKAQVGLSSVLDKEQLGKQEKAVDSDKLNGQKADYYAVKENVENEAAYDLDFSMDSSNYVLTVYLKNKSGVVLTQKSIDLPLETMVIGGRYDNETKKIILTLRGVDVPVEFSVADLISGLQGEINENNKLRVELIDGLTKAYLGLEKVINKGMDDKPTANSDNYVKSGGVYSELNKKIDKSQGSSNANKVFMTDASGNLILTNTIPSSSLPATGVSVDTAKQLEKTDGKIISADDTINKPLYNLGAFDTISGNVITRQTGYVNGKDYLSKPISKNGVNNPYLTIDNIYVDYIENIIGNCNRVDTNSWWNSTFSQVTISYDSTYKFLVIMLPNGATDTSSLNNIYIQYKLTTSYTEEIIEGQPLITLDSQGSQWLRSEWEKGLNLCRKFSTTAFRFIMTAYLKPNKQYYFTTNDTSNAQTPIVVITDVGGKSFTLRDNIYGSYLTEDTFVTPVDLTEGVATITIHINVDTIQVTQTMLNEGDHAYPYQPYNSKAHITNYEADFLKEESLKSANILKLKDVASTTSSGITYSVANNIITLNGTSSDFYVILPLEKAIPANTTISGNIFRNNTNISVYLWKGAWVSALNISTFNTVTTESEYSNIILQVTNEASLSSEIIKPMVWKGSTALPYQPYNGSIVREKQLKELDNKKANKSETYTKEETDSALSSAKSYTDTKIANLIGTAPETMDTLEEVANAIKEHQDVADALNAAIGNKANSSDLNAHTGNTSNPHNVTKTQLGLGNVDNTSDSEKEVASAKILKNNDIGSFTLSEGIVNGIDFNSNSVYLIYNNIWNFIIRIGDKSNGSHVQSTVCYDDNSKSKPLWFYYEKNAQTGLKLYLKTLSDTSYVQNYSYNGTFNYKLLSTD